MHMLLPVVFASLLYWPILRRFYVPAGVILMCVALAASSFATTSAGLIGTLGVLYGIGGSMCFGVCFVFLEDWFVKKRSIAYAIVFVSSRLAPRNPCLLPTHSLASPTKALSQPGKITSTDECQKHRQAPA